MNMAVNGNLSMQASTSQMSRTVRDKEAARTSERRLAIPHLILKYLREHGFTQTCDMLMWEGDFAQNIEVCDNIDLEMILTEYDSFQRMKFDKYPKLCKKIALDASEIQPKVKPVKTKKVKSVKEKDIQQTSHNNFEEDINLAMTVFPLFSNEDENNRRDSITYPKNQLKISESIEKLYPADSELRKIAEDVSNEIVQKNLNVHWEDVIGLEDCKTAIKEAVVYPIKYPIYFAGPFKPWKGILLYGPPGTGKTLLAKAVATECDCTFFNITASSLVSKWRGDSEKYIRVLFDLAYNQSPTIIFIDEIDWIATNIQNNSTFSEPAKRFRSELLARLDGLVSTENSHVVLLAATNAPWDIDAALLRRLEKRIDVPLPIDRTRRQLFDLYISKELRNCPAMDNIIKSTNWYSCADIKLICKEAWMLQSAPMWEKLDKKEICIGNLVYQLTDLDILQQAIKTTSTSVNTATRDKYTQWTNELNNEMNKIRETVACRVYA